VEAAKDQFANDRVRGRGFCRKKKPVTGKLVKKSGNGKGGGWGRMSIRKKRKVEPSLKNTTGGGGEEEAGCGRS